MTFSFVKRLLSRLQPKDRRIWFLLLGASLTGGLSRSIFLATINAAISARADGSMLVLYAVAAARLIAFMIWSDYFSAVRGRLLSEGLAIRMRAHVAAEIGQANLRFVERETVSGLHYHLMNTVSIVTESYLTLLTFSSAAVALIFNILYVGWLSPISLAVGLVVTILGIAVDVRFERTNLEQRKQLDSLRRQSHGAHHALLQGYKELRISGDKMADYRQRVAALHQDLLDATVKVARVSASGLAATDFFQYSAITVIGLGLPFVAVLEPITVMQLLAALLFTIGPVNTAVSTFCTFGRAQLGLDNLEKLSHAVEQTGEKLPAECRATLPPFETIELRNLSMRFDEAGEGVEDFQLGPVDLTIRRGDVVCISGGNGSGKSVLMRLLTGLYQPNGGEIRYNGVTLTREARQAYREQFTTVFNDFFLFKELLGRRATAAAIGQKWLSHFGLAGKTRYADGAFSTIDLSTGQRKRLALTVSVLDECPILVLDEFAAELDSKNRDRFYRIWLPELRKMGKTVVIVSHDDEYFDAADILVRMDLGKVVMCTMPARQGTMPA